MTNDGCLCWVGHGDCGGCSGVIGITHEPACGWDWNPHCPVHKPAPTTATWDQCFPPCFQGHQPRACGEHRTTGNRAWCYDCREWCYPHDGCIRCRHPEG